MRLKVLHDGYRPIQRLLLRALMGSFETLPGPVAVMTYRRALWGKHFVRVQHEAMRRGSYWKLDEVELFAAFISKQNACTF